MAQFICARKGGAMTHSTDYDSGETIVIQISIVRMLVKVKIVINWNWTQRSLATMDFRISQQSTWLGEGMLTKIWQISNSLFWRLHIRKETILNFPKQDAPEHFSYQPIVNNAMRNLLLLAEWERWGDDGDRPAPHYPISRCANSQFEIINFLLNCLIKALRLIYC